MAHYIHNLVSQHMPTFFQTGTSSRRRFHRLSRTPAYILPMYNSREPLPSKATSQAILGRSVDVLRGVLRVMALLPDDTRGTPDNVQVVNYVDRHPRNDGAIRTITYVGDPVKLALELLAIPDNLKRAVEEAEWEWCEPFELSPWGAAEDDGEDDEDDGGGDGGDDRRDAFREDLLLGEDLHPVWVDDDELLDEPVNNDIIIVGMGEIWDEDEDNKEPFYDVIIKWGIDLYALRAAYISFRRGDDKYGWQRRRWKTVYGGSCF